MRWLTAEGVTCSARAAALEVALAQHGGEGGELAGIELHQFR